MSLFTGDVRSVLLLRYPAPCVFGRHLAPLRTEQYKLRVLHSHLHDLQDAEQQTTSFIISTSI